MRVALDFLTQSKDRLIDRPRRDRRIRITPHLREQLFAKGVDPIGKRIRIYGEPFEVIGLHVEAASLFGGGDQMRLAMAQGRTTSRDIVSQSLHRIATYEDRLNAIITVNPRALAELLKPRLEALPGVTSVDVAGPGFINLRLGDDSWRGELKTILAEGEAYGLSRVGNNERVNVEYVSANPTGPMHMGHCR